jgi:hypothetical protein
MSRINRLLGSLRKNKLQHQLDDELQFHIEMRIQEFIAAGMKPEEARHRARRCFGNELQLKDETLDMDTIRWLETLWQDLRYAGRMLRKTPAFTAVVIATLALGIGANTAIFTLIDAVMLQNLPVKNPGELVLFYDGIEDGVVAGNGFPGNIFSYSSWEYFRDHNDSFLGLCAFRQGSDRLVMHVAGSLIPVPRSRRAGIWFPEATSLSWECRRRSVACSERTMMHSPLLTWRSSAMTSGAVVSILTPQ